MTDLKKKKKSQPKPHHTQGGFRNPEKWVGEWTTFDPGRMFRMIKERWNRGSITIPSLKELPMKKPAFLTHSQKSHVDDLNNCHLTWIGHSTVYCQLAKVAFITDPIFSQRASPCIVDSSVLVDSFPQWIGPKRYRDPACSIEDLPRVDFVLISHNHYDHLDYYSCESLFKKFNPVFYVPLKIAQWFKDSFSGVRVVELDWWENVRFKSKKCTGDILLHCFPCQHFARRGLFDGEKMLWCSWGVEIRKGEEKKKKKPKETTKLFFAGDTGYNPFCFKEIGRKFGEIDLSFIPIGAFDPRFVMEKIHVTPREAVQMALDVKSRRNLGIHWGTFSMALDGPMKAKKLLHATLKDMKLPPKNDFFFTQHHGETKIYDLDEELKIPQFEKEEEVEELEDIIDDENANEEQEKDEEKITVVE